MAKLTKTSTRKKCKKLIDKERIIVIMRANTVFLSDLSHQRTAPHRTAPHRTETLLCKNAVRFKRDVFDPPQHATLH